MKTKLALLLVIVSIGLHAYLTLHYYQLNFGLASGESICNLNSTFNCDNVAASPFSAIMGTPLGLWGAMANLVLAGFILMGMLGWTSNPDKLRRYTLWFSAIIASASIVMGFISVSLIGAYCIFCIAAYVLSFGVLILLRLDTPPAKETLPAALKNLLSTDSKYLFSLLIIPAAVLFLHKSYVQNIGASEISKILNSVINEWKVAPTINFAATAPALTKGASAAKMVISEFADFRCGHCKQAASTLAAFVSSRKDVKIQFYAFPLDGTCNEALKGGGDGISCLLAKNVYCAEKTAQKGWALHDHIFALQDKINTLSSLDSVNELLTVAYQNFSIATEAQKQCVENPDTAQAIRAQAKLGENSGVTGTPAIFVNDRKLSRGQLLMVLDEAYKSIP